jgi:hypothetical protein
MDRVVNGPSSPQRGNPNRRNDVLMQTRELIDTALKSASPLGVCVSVHSPMSAALTL